MDKERNKAENRPRIQWYEWGDSAFELATQRDVPILLYISTTWGSATHQFDLTVLSDNVVIEKINDLYLPVKIDALRNPDVAERYNQGAWPALCMLTPAGELLHGRTDLNAKTCLSALVQVAEYYQENSEEIRKQIDADGPHSCHERAAVAIFPRLQQHWMPSGMMPSPISTPSTMDGGVHRSFRSRI